MKVKKIEHRMYTEFREVMEKHPEIELTQYFGRWQYFLLDDKEETLLSIVCLKKDGLIYKRDYWEIADMTGEYPEPLERFNTFKEALAFGKRKFQCFGCQKNFELKEFDIGERCFGATTLKRYVNEHKVAEKTTVKTTGETTVKDEKEKEE